MALLFLLIFPLTLALARRWLGHWEEALPLCLALFQVVLLAATNLALHLVGWSLWPAVLPGLLLAALLAFVVGPRTGALSAFPVDRRVYALSALCLVVAWFGQGLVHDDDYGAHGAFQGQFLRGEFPPHNPFLPDIAVNGHYGHDLLVVVWARLTGLSLFTSQFLQTLLLQGLLPVLGYWALYRWSDDRKSSFWGTFFLSVAVRVGGRAGFLDTYQNNNPLAQLYFVLTLYFFARAWRYRRWLDVFWLGLVLGGYAVVYETQFGLACLASLAAFAIGLQWNPQPLKTLTQGCAVVALALALACTQGGPLTDLAKRLVSGHKVEGKLGHAAESQEVELRFPKQKLWQIRSSHDNQASVEAVSDRAWIYRSQRRQDPSTGYRPFWDMTILGLHHFPLFLCPLVLWGAWRRRDVLSLWLITFGITGFLVPAVVDFGPYYESEWFRWEYAAGLPLAGALGIWLSPMLEEALQSSRLKRLMALVFLLFCSSNAWVAGRDMLSSAAARWSQGLSIYAGAHRFVTSQPQLFCTQDDWAAMQQLRRLSQKGERVLVNAPDELWPNINFGSTLACFTGLYPVGNRKPLESDVGGQWPFRLRADTRAFWSCGDLRLLEMNPVQWLYWSPDEAFYPAVLPGLISGVDWKAVGSRRLGQVVRRWPSWKLDTEARPLEVTATLQVPPGLRSSSVYPVLARVSNDSGQALSDGRLLLKIGSDREDWLLVPVSPPPQAGQEWSASIPLAVPYEEGRVGVNFAWLDAQGVHPIAGQSELNVDFSQRLARLQLLSVTPKGPARAGQWLSLTSRWGSSQLLQEPHLGVRVALAAVLEATEQQALRPLLPGTGPGLAATVPNTSQQTGRFVATSRPDEWELTACSRLPDAPGNYRIDWFVAPSYGCGLRLRGQTLEVLP
ncbi:hypothetical protein IV102_18940 [bacterium]|nr:hypothetical protein [bacterium]